MIYLANDKYNAVLTQGYTVGDTILYVNTVPTNVPTLVVIDKGTDDEAIFEVTNKTTSTLTGVSLLRGANVNHLNGKSVICLNNEEFMNQYRTTVATTEALKSIIYGTDGGSTDDYVISLAPTPTAYNNMIGVPITFKANTANTGACTLNINSLGAKTIKKNYNSDLITGDIVANQIITVVYDGTNFQMQTHLPPTPSTYKLISATSYTTDTGSSIALTTIMTDFVVTAQAGALKLMNPTGANIAQGWMLIVRIKDNGTARALTYDTQYRASTDLTLPTTTVISKTLYMGFKYNVTETKWDLLAVLNNI